MGSIARWGAALVVALAAATPAEAQTAQCPGGRFLLLTNGKIHTMDAKRTVVSRVRIANGKFVEVGDSASNAGGCTDTIDLRGRTVIPGMIDNHFHVQLVANRPGYETRTIENAFTIAQAQDVIRERAKGVPEGAFITAVGGLQAVQFAENRLPTLTELDAAAPRHPVYIHASFNGPATTNTLGKKFLESKGVTVAANGAIAQNGPTWDALDALRSVWTLTDRKRTMQQVFSYFNSVGLTTVHSVLGSQERGPAQYFGNRGSPADAGSAEGRQAHAAAAALLQHRASRGRQARQRDGPRVAGQPGARPRQRHGEDRRPWRAHRGLAARGRRPAP